MLLSVKPCVCFVNNETSIICYCYIITSPPSLALDEPITPNGMTKEYCFLCRLIINDNLDCGTQLPFIKKAVEDGYGVMVLNTNLNRVTQDGKQMSIRVSIGNVTNGDCGVVSVTNDVSNVFRVFSQFVRCSLFLTFINMHECIYSGKIAET